MRIEFDIIFCDKILLECFIIKFLMERKVIIDTNLGLTFMYVTCMVEVWNYVAIQ